MKMLVNSCRLTNARHNSTGHTKPNLYNTVRTSTTPWKQYFIQQESTSQHWRQQIISNVGMTKAESPCQSSPIYPSIALTPLSLGTSPKWVATAEKSPPLPVQTLLLCIIQPFPSGSTSLTHVLFLLCPSISQVAFLYCLDPHFHSHTLSSQTPHSPSYQYVQTISMYFFSLILLFHNSLHLHVFQYHIFHTHLHCPHCPTLSLLPTQRNSRSPQCMA